MKTLIVREIDYYSDSDGDYTDYLIEDTPEAREELESAMRNYEEFNRNIVKVIKELPSPDFVIAISP